ncbi:MAG: cytochrome b [Gammaproteobacteria bacterium]
MVEHARPAQPWHVLLRAVHWVMVLLIVALMTLGWIAENSPLSLAKVELFQWHKSLGIVALVMVVVRIGLRLYLGRPRHEPMTGRSQRNIATLTHTALYGLMIAMPVSGWIINSAANFPFKLFGLIPLPALTGPDKAVQSFAEWAHLGFFWVFLGLIVLHAGAALYHHVVLRDGILAAMTSGFRRGGNP